MSRKPRPTPIVAKGHRPTKVIPPPSSTFRVLLVDHEPAMRRILVDAIGGDQLTVIEAANLQEARRCLAKGTIDLALVEQTLPDGSGVQLAQELAKQRRGRTQTIILSDQPSLENAIQAIRAGVADLLVKPLDLKELNDRVCAAIGRQLQDRQREQRTRRLRRICKKLNDARQEVTEQVDVLCNDLVTAYQELANQMQHVVQTSEYAGIIRDELDLEMLLRKTLEFIVQKAGPTNAAIFLPATGDEYTLGGYVNYDCTTESADVLLQHLADVLAPLMTDRDQPVHITDNDLLQQWIGDDYSYLADSHLLAFSAKHQDETLAVVCLFRDGSMPFEADLVETVAAIAPMMGDYLARIIRIHHRHIPDLESDDSDLPF